MAWSNCWMLWSFSITVFFPLSSFLGNENDHFFPPISFTQPSWIAESLPLITWIWWARTYTDTHAHPEPYSKPLNQNLEDVRPGIYIFRSIHLWLRMLYLFRLMYHLRIHYTIIWNTEELFSIRLSSEIVAASVIDVRTSLKGICPTGDLTFHRNPPSKTIFFFGVF